METENCHKKIELGYFQKKSFLEIFKWFHPILGDRTIITILLVYIFLSSSSKFVCFTVPYEIHVTR
jgi:hypothetical protein